MLYISDIKNTAPKSFDNILKKKVYSTLAKLNIPFERVNTDEAITTEDCIEINKKLDTEMVKTLFLCNRQKNRILSVYNR